ncbi:MAG: hypothetical protein J5498_03325 [Bacteroidales bacterium]|nr:hypothetical protein [Bacteroidales bacterium]MBO4817301.1 hypothetical protein [Bacteroidales bacterium]MBQ2109032.1 hypothetical protein [Bacteroidales bacterium]MBQ5528781.1 hypothetical protein [Bacteroidales bacterium]MDT3356394.1 hypothetical protein [Bacteroidota bacterium]
MIKLEILSPEAVLVTETVEAVTLPGVAGRFQVLNNHAPLITSLEEGEISYSAGGKENSLKIKSGFVEVRDNVVSVCVEV